MKTIAQFTYKASTFKHKAKEKYVTVFAYLGELAVRLQKVQLYRTLKNAEQVTGFSHVDTEAGYEFIYITEIKKGRGK